MTSRDPPARVPGSPDPGSGVGDAEGEAFPSNKHLAAWIERRVARYVAINDVSGEAEREALLQVAVLDGAREAYLNAISDAAAHSAWTAAEVLSGGENESPYAEFGFVPPVGTDFDRARYVETYRRPPDDESDRSADLLRRVLEWRRDLVALRPDDYEGLVRLRARASRLAVGSAYLRMNPRKREKDETDNDWRKFAALAEHLIAEKGGTTDVHGERLDWLSARASPQERLDLSNFAVHGWNHARAGFDAPAVGIRDVCRVLDFVVYLLDMGRPSDWDLLAKISESLRKEPLSARRAAFLDRVVDAVEDLASDAAEAGCTQEDLEEAISSAAEHLFERVAETDPGAAEFDDLSTDFVKQTLRRSLPGARPRLEAPKIAAALALQAGALGCFKERRKTTARERKKLGADAPIYRDETTAEASERLAKIFRKLRA